MDYSSLTPCRVFDEGHVARMGPVAFSIWSYLCPSIDGRTRSQDIQSIARATKLKTWTVRIEISRLHEIGYLIREGERYKPVIPIRPYR